jgi:NAD(P)H-hydrate epimerase
MMMNDIPNDLRALDRVEVFNSSTFQAKKRIRSFDPFSHKGIRGHAAIIAGSEGMMGASILATSACMKSGCGKTTAIVPHSYFSLIHSTIPEALVKDQHDAGLTTHSFDALAVGPGLGISSSSKDLLDKSFNSNLPLVIDADALNILAQDKSLLKLLPKDAILTPHHGEWERMFFKTNDDHLKIKTSIDFCNKLKVNLLLKGHYSILITPSGLFINGTGNAGMGKAGSGDVLTGILTSLLAQGYHPEDAGILGMYVHGLAGDFAREKLGEDYITATDIIHYLSDAFLSLRNG